MNRREFLTYLILSGAMAGVATPSLVTARPRFPRITPRSNHRKVVFISDIHLSADPMTSWMHDNIADLADFLDDLNSRNDVNELVILGDLLDDWMVPIEDDPSSFQDILAADHNKPVVAALQAICANPAIHVIYVTGNHDLLSFESTAKSVLEETFPNMEIRSEDPGLGDYTLDKVLWAEHGHRYSLFNSPDTWSHPNSHLPLGYFITRLVASQSEPSTTPEIIEAFVRQNLPLVLYSSDWQERLIELVFNAIARWADKGPDDDFIMKGKDHFTDDPTVDEVSAMYAEIMSEWSERQNIVLPAMALLNELGYMINSAQLLFTMPKSINRYYPFRPRIVLFGHTHKAMFWQRFGLHSTIYANTGTWIDGKPMTWVEVEVNDLPFQQRSYTVSLWYNGESDPRQSGKIVITS